MSQNVFIFHGVYGSPEENWFPWLRKELESRRAEVHVPRFPTRKNLTFEDWWEVFEHYETEINDDSVVVGHSLGVSFALKLIEQKKVRAAFFVAPAFGKTDNEFTPIMRGIAEQEFDWSLIREHCNTFRIFHSDNDPYLPVEKAGELAAHLQTNFTLVSDAGHFNTQSGYSEFPLLLDGILSQFFL